jgi:hypothetical protein
MHIAEMPMCCTSMVLGMFGDHGEESVVSVEEIKKLIARHRKVYYTDTNEHVTKKYVYASTVNLKNVVILQKAGFKILDAYPGQQGTVHVMALHLDN